jgi:nucleoside-diphosphate-sugar epimerase
LILLTGATGYVGAALRAALEQRGQPLRILARATHATNETSHGEWVQWDMGSGDDLPGGAFDGVSTVIHCAGLAHRHADERDYQRLNVEATSDLARRAVDAGVSHFIYVSSLNVVPFDVPSAGDPAHQYPEPKERYAASKWRAEQCLGQMFTGSHCQLTVLRPGLVYDVELTANLKTVKSVLRWWPWRLPSVGRRSMVARGDLVALLVSCALGESGAPTGEEILSVTDGAVYDAERISRALSQGIKWGVMPQWLCRLAGRALDWRASNEAGTHWRSLSADYWTGNAPVVTGWQPSVTLESCAASETERS